MNAHPTGTRHPHLDLGDLIALAAGQPVGDQSRQHLAGCEYCQLEAERWNLVAESVRGLATAAPATPQPELQQRRPRRVPAAWRRAMVAAASAAAALILVAGIGAATGVVHVQFGGHSSEPVLTSVSGCNELEQADGTLEEVHGTSLVVQTAAGRPVMVTTTASTFVSMSGALPSDITDGASVMVHGYSSDGTIRAAIVTVGQPFSAVKPSGLVALQGTVSDSSTAGFTLMTPTGSRVAVSTSASTLVVVPHARPDQLQTGSPIFALGTVGQAGTLSARAVAVVSQLRSGAHISVSVKNCSASTIIEALGALSQASYKG